MNEAQDVHTVLERNPEAGALLLALQLQAHMALGTSSTYRALYEGAQAEIEALRRELGYWIPLGQRYLELRRVLALPPTEEESTPW